MSELFRWHGKPLEALGLEERAAFSVEYRRAAKLREDRGQFRYLIDDVLGTRSFNEISASNPFGDGNRRLGDLPVLEVIERRMR